MSVRNREVPFSLKSSSHGHEKRMKFAGIRELGFSKGGAFVIDAWTTPEPAPRGSYFTTIPISPPGFRLKNPGLCASGWERKRGRLVIYSDYSSPVTIWAPTDILNELVGECVAQQLPQRER